MASIFDILTAIQQGVTAVNNLATTVAGIFPQQSAVGTTPPSAGTITFTSSQARAFMTVVTSSGASYKIPLY